jgi:hypothetical protein
MSHVCHQAFLLNILNLLPPNPPPHIPFPTVHGRTQKPRDVHDTRNLYLSGCTVS